MKRILLLNLVFLMINACNNNNGIQKETQKRITSHKQFIEKLFFEGQIINKNYCDKCNFNKYQIEIKMENGSTNEVALGDLSFPPYYSISTNSEITLSVDKVLYEGCGIGMHVKKNTNSTNLLIDDIDYKLLSSEKYQWVPNNIN